MTQYIGIDHIVLTVVSIDKSLAFYCSLLGMKEISFKGGRKAILCGKQKINLHEKGKEFEPKAAYPLPGSADFCLVLSTPLDDIIKILEDNNIEILEGPVKRTGARGEIRSIYLRDPDQNLVEISNYCDKS